MDNPARVKNNFPIEDNFESTRLFFAKETEFHLVWHLCDMALGSLPYANTLYYMALHGQRMPAQIRCDTVLQAKLRYKDTEYFCVRCLEEYEMAREIIERRKLMKFS